jgi:prophage regulatory protein
VKDDRIVREPERRAITGVCRSTAWVMEKAGTFPKRVALGGGRVGWRLSELQAWVESRRPVEGAA